MAWSDMFNFIFDPLLGLPPFFTVLVLSFLVSLLSLVITKYTTNQHLMKDLKDQLKVYQAEVKKLKDSPEKAMEVQKKAMDTNMQYMMHNLRGTLFTFLPIILIFGWASSHLSFAPILPEQEFSMTLFVTDPNTTTTAHVPEGITLTTDAVKNAADGKIVYTMKATKEGIYKVDFTKDEKQFGHEVIIGKQKKSNVNEKIVREFGVEKIRVDYEPLKIITFPFALPLFGEYFGWLGTYIIFAIVFSMALRKVLHVH